jgi:hypothetical protein
MRPRLAEAGIAVARTSVWRFLESIGSTLKKSLVFLDETWATTNMARRYGRAPRGERLIAGVPQRALDHYDFPGGRCATTA